MNQVYNRIESINGNVITVRASGVRYHELAQIQTRFGKSLAQVNKLDGDVVSLQVFAGGQGISTGDEVRFWAARCGCPSARTCWAAFSTARASR